MNTSVIQFITLRNERIIEPLLNCTFVPRVSEIVYINSKTYIVQSIAYVVEDHKVHGLILCANVYCIDVQQEIEDPLVDVKPLSVKDVMF